MIKVQRRWFIPSEELEEFGNKWRTDIMPQIRQQPGCLQIEVYESSIRGHYVTSVLWQDETSRTNALQQLSGLYNVFRQYERFEPEFLTLRPELSWTNPTPIV